MIDQFLVTYNFIAKSALIDYTISAKSNAYWESNNFCTFYSIYL